MWFHICTIVAIALVACFAYLDWGFALGVLCMYCIFMMRLPKSTYVAKFISFFIGPINPFPVEPLNCVYLHEPHGQFCVGFTLSYLFADNNIQALIAKTLVFVPFVGWFARLGGGIVANQTNITRLLGQGMSFALIPSGTFTMNRTLSKDIIVVKKRESLFRYISMYKLDWKIVPTLCTNEHEMYHHIKTPYAIARVYEYIFKYPGPTIVFGKYFTPIPLATPIIVRGEPLIVNNYNTAVELKTAYYAALDRLADSVGMRIQYHN